MTFNLRRYNKNGGEGGGDNMCIHSIYYSNRSQLALPW